MATSFDFETYYNKKAGLGIKQQGMATYIRDPRFDAYLISVSDGAHTWSGPRSRFNWDAIDGQELASHNAAFDSKVYKELVKRGLAPQIKIPRWHCTANLTTYLCSRRDLGRAVEFLLGEHVDKSTREEADGKTWDDLVKADGGKSMTEYGRRDALYCWTLWNRFSHLWPERERRLSEMTIMQGERGAQIDTEKLELYYSTACKRLLQAELALPWMKRGRKPTSTIAIAEECNEVGIPAPPVKSNDGEEVYDAWAAEWAPKYAWVKAYTDYRVIKKFIEQLVTIRERLYSDGCFPFDLLYFGAHTGRWAGSGGFNMQNMRKEPLFFDRDGWLITDAGRLKEIARVVKVEKKLPDWVTDCLDIRALFIARPGKKMIVSDLSQIEPRVLAWIVRDHAMLDRMARGLSPYQAHAEATMGWNRGDMKKLIELGDLEAKDLYALAKARVLGLGYGCGWKKFIAVAYAMAGLDITMNDPEFVQVTNEDGTLCFNEDSTPLMESGYGSTSRRIVREYREQNPLLAGRDEDIEKTGLWDRLDREFRDCCGGDFKMKLPSGRELRYPDVRQEKRAVADPENPGKYVYKRCFTAAVFSPKHNKVIRENLYGGKLTENLIQATARDVFGEHLIALENAGVSVLWNVHDEAVTEVDESISAKDVEYIMSQTPEWIEGLPVGAESKVVPHYVK